MASFPDIKLDEQLSPDPYYQAFLQDERFAVQQGYLQCRLHAFRPYADAHFLTELKRDFFARFWEMLVATELVAQGFSISSSDKGPDVCLHYAGGKIWIEATAARQGDAPENRVPEVQYATIENPTRAAQRVPTTEVKLRYTARLEDKRKVCANYLAKGIIAPQDAVVLALHAGNLPFSNWELDLPRIVECVFAIGDPYVTLNRETGEPLEQGISQRWTLKNRNDADIRHDLFLQEEYRCISAILFSSIMPHELGNLPVFQTLVHNPFAHAPLERGLIPVSREYYVEDGQLQCNPPEGLS
jgi:hypothetical protein